MMPIIRKDDLRYFPTQLRKLLLGLIMSEYSSIQGIRDEIGSWQSVLAMLRMENTQMKNELAGIIRKDIDTNLLETAEHFQQRFVDKDQLIDLLRLDIARLLRQVNAAEQMSELPSLRMIGSDMKKLQAEFNILKDQFFRFATLAGAA